MSSSEFNFDNIEPTEPRPQSLFGKRPEHITGEYSDETYELRDYQKELAAKAKQGYSTIICAPTGSGKTHVAIDIMVSHLRCKKSFGEVGRVAMFVPTVPLVNQQSTQISRNTYPEFFVEKVSGSEKITEARDVRQADTLLRADIVVLTPQIFINMLLNPFLSQKLYLTDFTMFVFDECHHCVKLHPYNVLMDYVRKSKYDPPQIIGLTASVGVGGDTKSKISAAAAIEHMTALCARLNVTTISSVRDFDNEAELLFHVSQPKEDFFPVRPTLKDDFAHEIALLSDYVQHQMKDELSEAIKELSEIKIDFDFPYEGSHGTNGAVKTSFRYNGMLGLIKYEVGKLHNKDRRTFLMKCFELLEIFHFTLKSNELLPAELALEYFNERIDEFDQFEPYYDVKPETYLGQMIARLIEFVGCIRYRLPFIEQHVPASNKKPILDKLIECIDQQYTKDPDSRILIFLEHRKSCAKLSGYLKKVPQIAATFGEESISNLVSVNQSSVNYGQSSSFQQEALDRFRRGDINILLATSVAEEGLDIAQCNLIINYNKLGTEKAYIQRRGRARAKDSRSVLLALHDFVEKNEYNNIMKEYLMNECLKALQAMSELELMQKIQSKKDILIAANKEEERRIEALKTANKSIVYKLECVTCGRAICKHSEIGSLMDSHFICCNPNAWDDTTIQHREQVEVNDNVPFGRWMCKCGTKRGEVIKCYETYLPTISPTSFRLRKEKFGQSSLVDFEKRNLTWKYITSKYFVVDMITTSQLQNMINSFKKQDRNVLFEDENNDNGAVVKGIRSLNLFNTK